MTIATKGLLEYVGKTKSTIEAITILSEKLGQKDVKPAVCISLKTPKPNSALNMLNPTLRPFLYEKNGSSPQQAQIEGVEVVSDVPNLTDAAVRMGTIDWDYEQTGCTLKIYNGATGHGDITLRSGSVRKVQLDCREGGTVDMYWQFYTTDVDAETIGELGILKSLERDVELTAPEIISQQKGLTDDEETLGGQTVEGAFIATAGSDPTLTTTKNPEAAWPFPLSGHKEGAQATVTTKPKTRAAKSAANKANVKKRA